MKAELDPTGRIVAGGALPDAARRASDGGNVAQGKKSVFIVHGHDPLAKLQLKNFLSKLGLDPILLDEQSDHGLTIVEKFEKYAAKCSFAFVIMTPDDNIVASGAQSSGDSLWQARPNVLLEMGWFMARLGRQNVVLIHKGKVEIPSDILGVVCLPFKDSVLEVSEGIRQRLGE